MPPHNTTKPGERLAGAPPTACHIDPEQAEHRLVYLGTKLDSSGSRDFEVAYGIGSYCGGRRYGILLLWAQ